MQRRPPPVPSGPGTESGEDTAGGASLRRRLPAGLVDSAFASLATFVVGLAAVTMLDDVARGVYAVFFTAFFVGTLLPHHLIFTPAEVHAVSRPESEQLAVLVTSLRLGIGPALAGAVVSMAIALAVTSGYATSDVARALTATVAITVVLSPMQDHVRRMLHIATLSWQAASISIIQFAVASAAVGVGVVTDMPAEWIPFGALVLANGASLTAGLLMSGRNTPGRSSEPLRLRTLTATGGWFVLNAVAPAVGGFAIAASIAWLASPEDLGYTESARVVAQPILVFATGLSAVLTPRAMRVAMSRDRAASRHTSRIYLAAIAAASILYLMVAGWDWALNPMAYLIPSAYVLTGLVALTIVANAVSVASFLQFGELMGARRERTLVSISWLNSALAVLGGLTAGFTGAYARSIGTLVGAGVQYGTQARVLETVYGGGPSEAASSGED